MERVRLIVTAITLCFIALSLPQHVSASTFADVYRRIKPSVVYIVVATANGAQSGSGFVYDSNDSHTIIATANHVITDAQHIDVIFDSDVRKRYHAKLLQHDRRRDVAFLDVPIGHRTPISLMDRPDIAEGNGIAVIGYPRATKAFEQVTGDDLRPSVHEGIISAVRLNGEIIQFDAQTDHGDSGGPVVDVTSGKVVAIVRGELLDRSYVLAGLEKPLPGSNYGASSPSIYAVRNGLGDTPNAGQQSAVVNTGAASPGGAENSASYRVAFAAPQGQNSIVQGMMDVFTQRIREHFTESNTFYAIPASNMEYGAGSSELQSFCDDLRVNALVLPYYTWQSDISLYGGADVNVGLVVTDCYGVPFFAEQKSKSESRFFANRTVQREVVDMGNDLIDHLLSDFDAYSNEHKTQWDDLLKFGVAADPNDIEHHLLLGLIAQDKQYRIKYVRPDALGEKAGFLAGDIILSIDGAPPDSKRTAFDVSQQLENASTVVVRRPDGDVTIALHPQAAAQTPATTFAPAAVATAPPASVDPAPLTSNISDAGRSGSILSPPATWKAGTVGAGRDGMVTIGVWYNNAQTTEAQVLTVASQPVPAGLTASEYATLTLQSLQRSIGERNVTMFVPQPLCHGTQQGWFIESNLTVGFRQIIVEQTIGLGQGQGFVATYRRQNDQPESHEAREALNSLCLPTR